VKRQRERERQEKRSNVKECGVGGGVGWGRERAMVAVGKKRTGRKTRNNKRSI
jgi:hypothetical protein